MKLVLAVPGAPPDRTNLGRCADRRSPNAQALVSAAQALIADRPTTFPIRWSFGMTVSFAAHGAPAYEGYGPDDPIIEVLQDVGVIADERQEALYAEREDLSSDGYVVIIEPERMGGSSTVPGGDALVIVAPDPPPTRTDPGRSADAHSPGAAPLARAGQVLVWSDPGAFPVKWEGIRVTFGRTLPDIDPLGYQPDHPIQEVLASVRAVNDPEAWWSEASRNPDSEFYVAAFLKDRTSTASLLEDRAPP